jgi:hypothetical protein
MSLFDNIDTKQRLQILRSTKQSLEVELFEVLTRLGIDFETYEAGQHPDFADAVDNWNKRRVIEIEATINTIEAKIAALGG